MSRDIALTRAIGGEGLCGKFDMYTSLVIVIDLRRCGLVEDPIVEIKVAGDAYIFINGNKTFFFSSYFLNPRTSALLRHVRIEKDLSVIRTKACLLFDGRQQTLLLALVFY